MKLLQVKPGPFHRIGDRYARLIDGDHFLGRDAFEDSWMTKPRTNVLKDDQGYTIELTVPGFKKEDIKVEIEDDILNVTAEKESSIHDEVIHQELADKRFRSYSLPDGINQNKITAKLEDGLLKISIPKKENAAHVKSTVKVA